MSDCIRRQKELNKGVEQYRCINKDAEHYTQLVVLSDCEACPVRRICRPKTKLCNFSGVKTGPIVIHKPTWKDHAKRLWNKFRRKPEEQGCGCGNLTTPSLTISNPLTPTR